MKTFRCIAQNITLKHRSGVGPFDGPSEKALIEFENGRPHETFLSIVQSTKSPPELLRYSFETVLLHAQTVESVFGSVPLDSCFEKAGEFVVEFDRGKSAPYQGGVLRHNTWRNLDWVDFRGSEFSLINGSRFTIGFDGKFDQDGIRFSNEQDYRALSKKAEPLDKIVPRHLKTKGLDRFFVWRQMLFVEDTYFDGLAEGFWSIEPWPVTCTVS